MAKKLSTTSGIWIQDPDLEGADFTCRIAPESNGRRCRQSFLWIGEG